MEQPIEENIQKVLKLIEEAKARRSPAFTHEVELVAVSKKQPISSIVRTYECGIRDFGENYVAELHDKAVDEEIVHNCPEIRWHFIGHLQSNKVSKLLACPNLFRIHTIDSVKTADFVQKHFAKMPNKPPSLSIMIQVNTSGEPTKSGVTPDDALELVEHVINKCPDLKLDGLMTLGAPDHDVTKGPNPDFVTLQKLKDTIDARFEEKVNLN
ncbi:pyridoxal phosphate homeostasis protein-like isoform X2 [Argiope bruennichi]|uniref:pyridoxal phosphate homeostasis protein-like isoform X2 n=1 Tax=Argiope bruennichi TaxID=94029 RepID=UPI002494AA02|nr:pyridoxal phosphate homeostasis protein-like isoform X2 [Argiope bruennichi]